MAKDRQSDELALIKTHLRVTWLHQDDDIRDMIDDGKAFIDGICGRSSYSVNGLATMLLKAYCRYAWSGSVAMFEENYKRQLLRLQIQNGFSRYQGGKKK